MTSLRNLLLSGSVLAGMFSVATAPLAQSGAPQPLPPDQVAVPAAPTTVEAAPADQPGAPPGDASETAVEEVVVTGSRIRRSPVNAPTPLIQLNREEILQSGEATVVDFLADVPALQNSQVPEDTTGNALGIGGLSQLNLRNLGVDRTLVLVDGRRHVGGSQGSASVDVDTIPSLLIQNVEIITGGASALYGADAVSGVVNFILRRDFEGVEIDASYGQINQDGQHNVQLQALVGRNFLDERLNVYLYAGYQELEEVVDTDIDWLNENQALFQNDLDPTNAAFGGVSDGVLDVLRASGFGTLARPRGGQLTLANSLRPTSLGDPDIPPVNCAATTAASFSANCFTVDPPFTFVFDNNGTGRLANFGTFRAPAGANRTLVIGSPDAAPLTAFQDTRLPEQDALRFQTGANFSVNDSVQLFGEVKYVEENNFFNFQPGFFNIGLTPLGNSRQTLITSLTNFQIGTDNAYLDAATRDRILTNRRQDFDLRQTITVGGVAVPNPAFGQPTTSVLDQRALQSIFSYDLGGRGQDNHRELTRFVVGARGERDTFLRFIDNLSWEVGYTYGRTEDSNVEPDSIDVERLAYAADAVRNAAGQIVCRVTDRAARGLPNTRPFGGTSYAPDHPTITGCVPVRVFGEGGFSEQAKQYILFSQQSDNRNVQQDLLAFASGELWDFFGAGPLGVAVGAEYREERTSSNFTSPGEDDAERLLFVNILTDFPEATFDVSEAFAEVRLPLLRDRPFAERLEISGNFRRSDYSTLGRSNTYGVQALYRPVQDILFRATYGRSVRAPNLSELFAPQGQNFAQLIDGCSRTVIDATIDQRIRNNRNRNCAQLGVPITYVDPDPNGSNTGVLGGNPNLAEEESTSYTFSIALNPQFLPGFSVVLDYYSIDIDNAIAALTAQAILNLCTDADTFNADACALVPRNPQSEVEGFVQGPLNFAGLRARGIDLAANYNIDLADMFERDYGDVRFSLRGNYLIRRQNFTNPVDPGQATNLDSTVNNPRVRLLAGVTYSLDRLALTYELDHQTSQELLDDSLLLTNPDSRSTQLYDTGSFTQHDISVRYQMRDDVVLRAGVVNFTDEEPNVQTGASDNFDLFGRRYFVGLTFRR